jgi:putative serine protease PepD
VVKPDKVPDGPKAATFADSAKVEVGRIDITGRTVGDVKSGGAADQAGIGAGDISTRLGDTAVTTIASLAEAPASDRPVQRTTVTYSRNGGSKKAVVTLGEQ